MNTASKTDPTPDIIGMAIRDYHSGNYTEDIITETSISEEDILPVPYLFRSYEEMPEIEQVALMMARGKVLDIGCGAGSHALYLQEQKRLEVTAIDNSLGAVEICRKRGLTKTVHTHLMKYTETGFDTILLLMNGLGLCGKLNRIGPFLQHLKSLLKPDGQILLDSSDILYMFDEDEDGGKWIPSLDTYYGELEFRMRYKDVQGPSFPWLFCDYNTLQNAAIANGLHCELLLEGPHFDYLAKLSNIS
ncbi:SAM-dependent methyltransferase [Sinomicrobium sp.]